MKRVLVFLPLTGVSTLLQKHSNKKHPFVFFRVNELLYIQHYSVPYDL